MGKQGHEKLGLLEELELVHGMHEKMLQLLKDLGFPPSDGQQQAEAYTSEADAHKAERRFNICKGAQGIAEDKEKLEKRIDSLKKEDAKRRGQSGVQKKTTQARKTRRKGNKWTKAKKP